MGNLEKAGVGVVVALLLVIMIVAFTTEPETGFTTSDGGTDNESGLQSERRVDSEQADAEVENPSNAGQRRLDEPEPDLEPEPAIVAKDQETAHEGDPDQGDIGQPIGAATADTAKVPAERSVPAKTEPATSVTTGEWPKTVVAKRGDSLWTLAVAAYGSQNLAARMTRPIIKTNGLKSDRIGEGDKLRLPAPPPGAERVASAGGTRPSTAPRTRRVSAPSLPWEPDATPDAARGGRTADGYYIVKKNESLSQIAERELGSVKRMPELIALNGIKNKNRIHAGMRLKLPAKK